MTLVFVCGSYAVNPVKGDDTLRPSPYRHGMFLVRCHFRKQYPATPPEVTFISRVYAWARCCAVVGVLLFLCSALDDWIPCMVSCVSARRSFHPNINSEGGICTDDFKKLWKPQSNVLTVIEMLRAILANPNPDDPLEMAPGEMMKKDLAKFEAKVIEMIKEDNSDSDDGGDDDSDWEDDDVDDV